MSCLSSCLFVEPWATAFRRVQVAGGLDCILYRKERRSSPTQRRPSPFIYSTLHPPPNRIVMASTRSWGLAHPIHRNGRRDSKHHLFAIICPRWRIPDTVCDPLRILRAAPRAHHTHARIGTPWQEGERAGEKFSARHGFRFPFGTGARRGPDPNGDRSGENLGTYVRGKRCRVSFWVGVGFAGGAVQERRSRWLE